MIESAAFEAKKEAMKLLSSLGELGTSAYVVGLAHIIDDPDLSEMERRHIAVILRREILLTGGKGDAHRIADGALARAYQNFAALRSSQDFAGALPPACSEPTAKSGLAAGSPEATVFIAPTSPADAAAPSAA